MVHYLRMRAEEILCLKDQLRIDCKPQGELGWEGNDADAGEQQEDYDGKECGNGENEFGNGVDSRTYESVETDHAAKCSLFGDCLHYYNQKNLSIIA